jgi:hypothetical protein
LGKDGFKASIFGPNFRSTNLNGSHEYGGDPASGTVQARNVTVNADEGGPNGTLTELAGVIRR